MQHLWEVSELCQLPGSSHAGALWRKALQVYSVWSVFHHQWQYAQVGEMSFALVADCTIEPLVDLPKSFRSFVVVLLCLFFFPVSHREKSEIIII